MRILADEDFRGPILNALRTVLAESRLEFDIVRVQDIGLLGASDPTVLDHAARDGRVVVSCDILTMPPYAFDRIGKGMPMPGLIVVKPERRRTPRLAAEDLVVELLERVERVGSWENQVAVI